MPVAGLPQIPRPGSGSTRHRAPESIGLHSYGMSYPGSARTPQARRPCPQSCAAPGIRLKQHPPPATPQEHHYPATRQTPGQANGDPPAHETSSRSHQHDSDRHKRNQAPRNAGLTQHNRRDSHQGKSQQRRIKNAQTCRNTQRPAHRIAGTESQHDRKSSSGIVANQLISPLLPTVHTPKNPSNTGRGALSST